LLQPKFRVAGISFEHMHMGDNLRLAFDHPACEIVGICDTQRDRMVDAQKSFHLPDAMLFSDWEQCVQQTRPDFVILCPSTGDHALWVERLAPFGLPLLIEKPMAASLKDADRMLAACERHDVRLAINWPLVWVPSHRTAKRLVDEGRIGKLLEVHYYDGNRGPLWHAADKVEYTAEDVARRKPTSWFYQREQGGGSLLDYLGYGVTLGSWFLNGAEPIEVTCICDEPAGLEVDEHSVTVVRYGFGLSKFETRWGTYTDPWSHQPQPKCGFVLVGSEGTISSYDYESTIRVQDVNHPGGIDFPVDEIVYPNQNVVQYFVDCLTHNHPIEGPLSPALSRLGQRIVDTAYQSAKEKRTLPLVS
jgi:predicted dehydrogenase